MFHWLIDASLRALTAGASALVYSPVFNPRRTEDTSYGIWTTVLIALAEKSRPAFNTRQQPSLLIVPQYNIYVSRKSNVAAARDDPDFSFATQSDNDGQMNSFFTDLAVLRLDIKVLGHWSSESFLGYLQSFVHSHFPHQYLWVSRRTEVMILVELKPPPTRTPDDIADYERSLSALLQSAQHQVTTQGHCLMCTRRFAKQDSVVLIAGAGDWWRCRLWTRQNAIAAGDFSLKHMLNSVRDEEERTAMLLRDQQDAITDEYDELMPAEEEGDFTASAGRFPESGNDRALPLLTNKEKANQDRTDRAQKREVARNLDAKEREAEKKSLIANSSYPFSTEELNLYGYLHRPTMNGDFIANDKIEVTDDMLNSWSPVLRLGSEASDR
ncbi:hypothetical protein BT96DRAFT_1006964 [Gymnopus androsaceus JB14]|uniref:Uncharacterized protein n=1 Tax=Gymnopus androsaceus JB14 TaxID=1447944 RepID=A0A6A4GIX7_9AGAR|nr:hypothetical protein BT96DRAFT_1006964 [Gymnopus androsaceus JB14]